MTAATTHAFHAMGCEILVGGATADEAAAVERLFAGREQRFSRFLATSELSRVNASDARALLVSPAFARALRRALRARRLTGGLVDPTVHDALVAAGYDRDLASVGDDPRPVGRARVPGVAGLRLSGTLLRRPPGLALDLNGVVKGMAVDDALGLLSGPGFVSAGGDAAVRGGAVVGLPGGGAIELRAGGIATSGTDRRRWLRAGREQHHLIDPRSGAPADSPWSQVTVVASTCADADVAARAALLLGTDGPAWLDRHGLAGRFLATDGAVLESSHWITTTVSEEAPCT